MSVQKIIRNCCTGEAAAWDEFITLVQPVVSGVGRKYVIDDVEDFSQNVYVALIADNFALLKRFKSTDEFELLRYIRSVAWRIAKNQKRRNNVRLRRNVELNSEHELAFYESEVELKIIINDAMMQLPFEEREILTLLAAGYKFREIADILDKPIGTIMSKANRTQKKLKKHLELQ